VPGRRCGLGPLVAVTVTVGGPSSDRLTREYPALVSSDLGSAVDAVDTPSGAGFEDDPRSPTGRLLALKRMESAVIRGDLEHPGELDPEDVQRWRYLISFAGLTRFQPGAAPDRRGSEPSGRTRRLPALWLRRVPADGPRPEVDVAAELERFRALVLHELTEALRDERDPKLRLAGAAAGLRRLVAPLEETRHRVIDHHRADFSAAELDAEVGTKTLVLAAGGGGGAGYGYIGALRGMDERGIAPAYVIGSSIGALMAMFRARTEAADWDVLLDIAKALRRRDLFSPLSVRRRYGLPGLVFLNLADVFGPLFLDESGEPLLIKNLPIPYEAVVAGVRRGSYAKLPRRFRSDRPSAEMRRSSRGLGAAVAARMWQVAAFFDPRVVKPIVVGGDQLTKRFTVVDAAGFSAAVPGVLHYDVAEGHHLDPLLAELLEREDVAALIDGGVASNVPAEQCWRSVQAGKIGTRNVMVLALDCFHPQWDPRHLWLQPITQAVQLQMARNARYADWIVRIEPTLSPVNLVPSPKQIDQAAAWGQANIEPVLPMIERFLEPVAWDGRFA
jgi:predicted acylesterase/phospholipase RssA